MLDLDVTPERQWLMGAGVFDGLSARLACAAGYDLLWLSSFSVSASMGLPDINIVTYSDMAARCAMIAAVCENPVIVDIDNGYGATANAVRASSLLEASGASAVCIEDAAFPKRCSFYEGVDRALTPLGDATARIATLKERLPNLTIIARTEALVVGGDVEAAHERVRSFWSAGADAIMVQVPRGGEAMLGAILDRIDPAEVPVVVTPTGLDGLSSADLGLMGVRVVIHANAAIRTMASTVAHILGELSSPDRPLSSVAHMMSSIESLAQVTAVDDWLPLHEDAE